MIASTLLSLWVGLVGAYAPAIAEEHSLLPNVKVGDSFAYVLKSTMESGQGESTYNMHYVMSVESLEPQGTITFKNEQSNGTFKMGDQEREVPESVSHATFKINGELISTDPVPASKEQARFGRVIQMVVPTDPATVGMKWTWTTAPTEAAGMVGVEGSAECMAFESHLDIPCAKLHIVSKETGEGASASGSMDVWYSLKDGLPVETVVEYAGMPLAPGVAGTFKATTRRVTTTPRWRPGVSRP